MARKASAKMERFIAEYLRDLNASQAAKRAGYSQKNSHGVGARLLKHPDVKAAIAEAQAKHVEVAGVTAQRVLQELARIAFGDIRTIFDAQGNLVGPTELSDDAAALLASIEIRRQRRGVDKDGEPREEEVVKVKAWDKNRALELLAKHLGLLKDQVEHSGGITVAWED